MDNDQLLLSKEGTEGRDLQALFVSANTGVDVGGTVVTDMERSQVEDMIAASEARTDTKFARLEGKVDLLIEQTQHSRAETAQELSFVRERLAESREDQRSTRNTVLATVLPSALAIALLVLGLWQYGSDKTAPPERPAAVIYTQPQPQSPVPVPTQKAVTPPTTQNRS